MARLLGYRMNWIYRTYWINWLAVVVGWFWKLVEVGCGSGVGVSSSLLQKVLLPKIGSRQLLPALFIFDVLDKDFSIWINGTVNLVSRKTEEAISTTIQEIVDNHRSCRDQFQFRLP